MNKKEDFIEENKNENIEENNEKEEIKENNNNEIKKKISCKDILFYFGHSFLILMGIVTVIFQFVPINFFNIVFKD